MSIRRPRGPARAAALAGGALALLLPAAAAGAPAVEPGDGEAWSAAEGPPTYVVTGTAPGATLRWQLQTGAGVPLPGRGATGPSPLTVVLRDLADGGYRIVAGQISPADPGRTVRTLAVDTVAPVVTVREPRPGAVYQRGERVLADYSCQGATTCDGTVADGAPIDTSAAGPGALTVTAADAAGNAATARVEYRVAAPSPPAAVAAAPAGTPEPPSPPIRLAPEPPGETGGEPEPETRRPWLLRPPAGSAVTTRRPVLRWRPAAGARLYNVQVFRLRGEQATKVVTDFPTANRYRVPAGRLSFGERYVWRVWPLVAGAYPAEPHGLSWFDLRRPVRLTSAQLLVNQRISQAALRRTAAVAAWLDAGLVTGDLRDGGLGAAEFGEDVRLSDAGAPIANGLATPRAVVVAATPRPAGARLRVSAAQLLVNQRVSQAAVRRANALRRRLDGALTGGDLRPGAVTATKLAPGARILWARPAGPPPAPSSSASTPRTRRPAGRVAASARQVLVNQRISQAAVRRANALVALAEGGLTGAQFRDGAITAVGISPQLRS